MPTTNSFKVYVFFAYRFSSPYLTEFEPDFSWILTSMLIRLPPIPVFLTSRKETQTMVREKLGPKPRPPQTLYLPGKGETQTIV